MTNILRGFCVALILLLAITAPALADTQSVSGCSGCNGYSFTASLTPTGTAGQYTLVYTITNVSGSSAYAYNWSLTLFNNSPTNVTLDSVKKGATTYTGDYQTAAGKSSNGNANCQASVSGAFCVEPKVAITSLPTLNIGQSLTFTLTITCPNCTELASWDFLSSGDCVANTNANCYAISTTPVPEPPSFALLGISTLAGLGTFARRKLCL
jgi:hypothetical protein